MSAARLPDSGCPCRCCSAKPGQSVPRKHFVTVCVKAMAPSNRTLDMTQHRALDEPTWLGTPGW